MTQDRWRLIEKLGNGYFGTTFRAEDTEGVIAEPIAMKLIPLAGVRGLHEDSLLKEISQLYALTHANLVAVRAEPRRIEFNGIPHLAIGLELCETTLADELRQSDDRDRLMRVVVADVLQGLMYMHDEMGTVHRDLHAGNILRRGRTWKIGDFGQARFVNDHGVVPGGPVGAREIVAPEVARGEAASVAVDIYALGVLVHYSLTDRYLVDTRSPKRPSGQGAVQIHDSLPREWRPFVSAATQELANRPTAQAIRSLVPRLKSSSETPDDPGRRARGERSSERTISGLLIAVACSSLVDGHFEVFVLDA
ncbi:MAG TPA: protein kinase, partial [Ilumatobacteraceae bacterium]|nr:protein kinase [Ilumatobacteraceae bacterium]